MKNSLFKKGFWVLFFILIFFLSQNFIFTEQLNFSKKIKDFEEFVKNQMKIDRIPGLTIGFYKDDYEWVKGFGYSDLENKTPATKNSVYRLASNTKPMTAVAILQLKENKKLKLDDNIRKYVPYFPRKNWPVSVRQLLGHIGGISHYKDYEIEGHIKLDKDTRESIKIFSDFQLVNKPGTAFNYSSYGYNLLGAVIEGASKMPYGKYLKTNIWKPLNMENTYMDRPENIIQNRVQGYRLVYGELLNSEFVNITSRFAAGGTLSTVIDMLKYAKGLENNNILNKESTNLMEKSMTMVNGKLTDYGMGWVIHPVNGHFMAYHTGGQPETRTILIRFPTLSLTIAVAYNLEGGNLYAFTKKLYQMIMNEAWNRDAYTGNLYYDSMIKGLNDIFNYGMAYFEYHNSPLTISKEELKQSFNYMNKSINFNSFKNNPEKTIKMIENGRHPIAGKAYVKIGSFIASLLKEKYNNERLEYYHKMGALSFMKDYINLYNNETDNLSEYKFSPDIEEKIKIWEKSWRNTFSGSTRNLYITSFSDLSGICKDLKNLFKNQTIYPDFTKEFLRAITDMAFKNPEKAVNLAKKIQQLYPKSSIPYLSEGHAHLLNKDYQKAKEAYKEAIKLDLIKKETNASKLNSFTFELTNRNKLETAISYLDILKNLYPEKSIFYNTAGRILLEKSKRELKIALEKNPNSETAWKLLKKIED